VIKSEDEPQTLIEELLRLRVLRGNRVMKVPKPSHQRDGMRLSVMRLRVRGRILGGSAQAQKHSTQNVHQNLHLVNPPEFSFGRTCGRASEKSSS
jgi:hypothetical protein